jgi:hypothetical protein
MRRRFFESTRAATRSRLFVLWRFDFLIDEALKAWLLEVEIVPSTGQCT